jgi:hypothetical protein
LSFRQFRSDCYTAYWFYGTADVKSYGWE